MNAVEQFALRMIQQNPQVANKPLGKEFINILQSGDAQRGIQLANNLCQTYNTSPNEAVEQARNYFHF